MVATLLVFSSSYTKTVELNYFMITMAKTGTNYHLSQKAIPFLKEQIQKSTFPSWFTQYLWLEVVFRIL